MSDNDEPDAADKAAAHVEPPFEVQQTVEYAPDYRVIAPNACFFSKIKHPDQEGETWVLQLGYDGPRHKLTIKQGDATGLVSGEVRYLVSEVRMATPAAVDILGLVLRGIRRNSKEVYDRIIAEVEEGDDRGE